MSGETIPCGQLAIPALIARVASTMDSEGMSRPPYELRPGFCRFCNHPLPYAMSATAFIDGVLKRVEWNPGDPIGSKLQLNEAAPIVFGGGAMLVRRVGEQAMHTDSGLRPLGQMIPTILLAANGACDALTGAVFAKASAIAREKGEKRRTAIRVNINAREMAAQKAARAAAKRLAGPMAEALATPAAPDNGEF